VAAELKKSHGVESKLIAGAGGVFDVKVDGQIVYTKAATGRFPKPGEASAAIG